MSFMSFIAFMTSFVSEERRAPRSRRFGDHPQARGGFPELFRNSFGTLPEIFNYLCQRINTKNPKLHDLQNLQKLQNMNYAIYIYIYITE